MNEFDRRNGEIRLGGSSYLGCLASKYALAPSAVLVRTAEVELLSTVMMEPPVLDLCCGDGFFCSLVCSESVEAGCDLSLQTLRAAHRRGQYRVVACADVTRGIPFRGGCFQSVVSNSSLEHVSDIDATLHEVARVLRPGGKLFATMASSYAYEWWPCGKKAMERYLSFQPVHNYFSLDEWRGRMEEAGLKVIGYQYYLTERTTRILMFLDYHFSHVHMTSDRTLARPVVRAMQMVPRVVWARIWQMLFSGVRVHAEEKGGGILLVAERAGVD